MAETVGRVDILADIDTSMIDKQIKALGNKIGTQLGNNIGKSFNKEFSKSLTTVERDMNRASKASDRLTKSLDTQFLSWKRLPHGFRQFSFYVALFANLAQQIGTLSSTAGAGIFVLGGALTNFGVGVGTLIAAFQNFTGDLEELPEEVRPAAAAFKELNDQLSVMQRAIQVSALKNSEGAFKSLRGTVEALTPAFEEVGRSIGKMIDGFAEGVKPGTRAFKDLDRVIRNSGPVFQRIGSLAGKFGKTLLTIFASPALNRAVNEMIDWLDLLFTRFDDFANSKALDTWFRNASVIFGAIGRLLDSTGRMLNDLVTPQAVERLADFLDKMAEFMPMLTPLLDALGRLDVFGIIADALVMLGEALSPLAGPMGDLAEAVHDLIEAGLDQLAGPLEAIATALAPVVQGLADFIAADPDAVASGLIAIAAGAVVLKGAQGLAGLATMISGVTTQLKGLGKTNFKGIASGLATVATVSIVSEMTNPASQQNAEEQIQTYWTNVLTGGIIGAITGGPFGAAVGIGFNAIYTTFTRFGDQIVADWNQIVEEIAGNDLWARMGEDFDMAFGEGSQWQEFWGGIGETIGTFVATLQLGWDTVVAGVVAFIGTVIANFVAFWANLWITATTWWNTFIAGIIAWFGTLVAGFVSFINDVVTNWNNFWNGLFTTVSTIWNNIVAWVTNHVNMVANAIRGFILEIGRNWNSFWSGFAAVIQGAWQNAASFVRSAGNSIVDTVNWVIDRVNDLLNTLSSLSGGMIDINIPNLPRAATGRITTGPTIAGEAGPEMIIPLTGPLSRVNRAVRPYAEAIRNGGSMPGTGRAGKIVNVEAGAIVVQTTATPMQVATAVLDRLDAQAAAAAI